MRREEAAAQWLRQAPAGAQQKGLAARMIEIGHKLIEAGAFMGRSRWLPWLREHREAAVPTGTPLDAIDDALCRTAETAACWEVNPSTDNDNRLTRLVEQAQDAIARAYPPTETTLRLLQHITPDGLQLALIQCEDSGSPLIAISIDADHTLRWRQAVGAEARPAVAARRLSAYVRKIVPFTASQ